MYISAPEQCCGADPFSVDSGSVSGEKVALNKYDSICAQDLRTVQYIALQSRLLKNKDLK